MEQRGDSLRQVILQADILRSLGHEPPQGARVLDFGCGAGDTCAALVDCGFDGYGCDIVLDGPSERLRKIEDPYRIPFPNDHFDFVCSDQVFEHVQDLPAALSEIGRVLKPGAPSLHFYPATLTLREEHTLVPLASVIQSKQWLKFWANRGIRNSFQEGLNPEEVVKRNARFLAENTTYVSRRHMLRLVRSSFSEARFVEAAYLNTAQTRARLLRYLAPLYGTFRARVLLAVA